MNRRDFLTGAASAAAFTIVSPHVLGGTRHVAPSDKVNVALIGAGGQGRSNLRGGLFKLDDVQVIALADPAEEWDLTPFYYKGKAGRGPIKAEIEAHYAGKSPSNKVAVYEDFRTLLEKQKDVDAILCATPDHLHATVSLHALKAGKHVYCEKPMAHNIAEARLVAKVARETKLATQMGNQGHANEGIRKTIEWIHAGAIGKVEHVHAWVGTSRWNPTLQGKPTETMKVPDGLNWDLWLGPREARPFHQAYAPVSWRDFWSFGLGALGDFGCHDLDSATWALDLKAPSKVEGTFAGKMDSEITPYGSLITYQFEAKGDQKPVTVHWYDGGLKPPVPDALPAGTNLPGRGVLFVGDKGAMLCGGAGGEPKLFPASRDMEFERPAATLARSKGHHRDWIDAIKGGPAAGSNFDYASRLTEITLLGVLALRIGRPIAWDTETMTVPGVPGAEPIIKGLYRKGWELL